MSRLKNMGDGNRQIVVLPEPAPAAAAGAIVEYKEPDGTLLKEDAEDLEVKLRRIIDHVPVRVSNTSGSSAGSGSGDFHQYRQMRRKEQDRLTRMDVDYQKRKELAEFNARREERIKAAEERTAKKRAKRQKKKDKKKQKKEKLDTSASGQLEEASGKLEEVRMDSVEDSVEENSTDCDSSDEHQIRPLPYSETRSQENIS